MKNIQLKKKKLWFVASCCIFLILYIIYTYFYVEIETDIFSNNSIIETAEQTVDSANISTVVTTENVVEPNKFVKVLRSLWKYLIQNGSQYPIYQNKWDHVFCDVRDVNHLQTKLQPHAFTNKFSFSIPVERRDLNTNTFNVQEITGISNVIVRQTPEIETQISNIFDSVNADLVGNTSSSREIVNTSTVAFIPSYENTDIEIDYSWGTEKELWYGLLENYPDITDDEKVQLLYKYTCQANNQEKGLGFAKEFPTIKPYKLRNQNFQDPLISKEI